MGALILTITASLLYFADVSSFYQSLIDGADPARASSAVPARATISPGWCGDERHGHRDEPACAAASAARGRSAPPCRLLLLVLTLVLLALGERLAPGFASANNILQLLKLASFLGLVALGQTIVMLVGGIDLSDRLGAHRLGRGLHRASAPGRTPTSLPAAVAALAVGLVVGLVNGFGVVKLRISPIVMTLAMNNIMLGATLVYTGGTPSGGSQPAGPRARQPAAIGGVPWMVLVWAA